MKDSIKFEVTTTRGGIKAAFPIMTKTGKLKIDRLLWTAVIIDDVSFAMAFHKKTKRLVIMDRAFPFKVK